MHKAATACVLAVLLSCEWRSNAAPRKPLVVPTPEPAAPVVLEDVLGERLPYYTVLYFKRQRDEESKRIHSVVLPELTKHYWNVCVVDADRWPQLVERYTPPVPGFVALVDGKVVGCTPEASAREVTDLFVTHRTEGPPPRVNASSGWTLPQLKRALAQFSRTSYTPAYTQGVSVRQHLIGADEDGHHGWPASLVDGLTPHEQFLLHSADHEGVLVPDKTGSQKENAVVVVGADWCGPCVKMKPLIALLKSEGQPVKAYDFDEHREYAEALGVSELPAFVQVMNGKIIKRHTGPMRERELRRWLAEVR